QATKAYIIDVARYGGPLRRRLTLSDGIAMRVPRVLHPRRGISIILGVPMIVGCTPHRVGPTAGDAVNVLSLRFQADHPDIIGREPIVIQDPRGTLFASGYGWGEAKHPSLRKSDDRGRTWSRVDVGDSAQGAIGNSDVDLAVAPDGTLYFI